VNEAGTANPAFTADAVNKGIIYTYIKHNAHSYDNANQEYKLVERIAPQQAFTTVKIPGRTTNTYQDFMFVNVSFNLAVGVNFFDPYLQFFTERYDQTQQKYVLLEEALGKSAAFFRDLAKDMPQFRHVIVNGSAAGRMNGDFKDYAAVKKAFTIPD